MTAVITAAEARAKTRASAGTIALTFDDGPDPVWTARVLAELERHQAAATFFVDARQALARPELIGAMSDAGHEVGFHCVRHVRHSDLGEEGVRSEVDLGLAMLESLGVRPAAWRAPWGVVTAATRRLAAEHGLDLWNWSFDSHDWRGDDCERMLAALRVDGGLADGTVALMHDALGPGARREGCAETVRLTAALLEAAAALGLRPAPLSTPVAAEAR
jgi:peptidoglycan/xylan/chitin deacetylase (PgdA/CDA1 family)